MGKKISIIIPIYNSHKYIERCIKSIINQTYDNLEIIIVNDGSIDKSLCICEKLKQQDNRIKIISQTHKGVGIARNVGINLCTGDYVSFIDSDDTIDYNFFEKLIDKADTNDFDVVGSNVRVLLENKKICPYEKNGNIGIFQNEDLVKEYLNFNISTAVWGKIYKRNLIDEKRFLNININEDFIFEWEIMKCANSFYQVNSTHYNYFTNIPNSLTKKSFNKNNMSLVYHAQMVAQDVSNIYPNLIIDGENYFYACVLHNYVIYFKYLISNHVDKFYLEEKNMMESILSEIKQLDKCLLIQESKIDIKKMIKEVNRIIDSERRNEKCL